MTVLNAADAIMLDGSSVDRIMLDGLQVWPGASVPLAPQVLIDNWNRSGGASQSVTIDSTGCDAYILQCSQNEGSGNMTPSSNKGGTFAQISTYLADDTQYFVRNTTWLCQGLPGGTSHTFSVSNSSYGTIVVVGLVANGSVLTVDQINSPAIHLESPHTSSPLTPTKFPSLGVALLAPLNYGGDGSTAAVDAPWVDRGVNADGTYYLCGLATRDLTNKDAVTATFRNNARPDNWGGLRLLNIVNESAITG